MGPNNDLSNIGYKQWAQDQDNNKNKNKNKNKKPRISNIGVPRSISVYPSKSVLDDQYEKRLSDIFGKPYRNRLLSKNKKNKWSIHCNLTHSRMEWASYSNDAKKFVKEEVVGRGFAINQRNGYIATMSSNYLWIFEPLGSSGFKLLARYTFTDQQKLNGEDVQNSRIRFVNQSV